MSRADGRTPHTRNSKRPGFAAARVEKGLKLAEDLYLALARRWYEQQRALGRIPGREPGHVLALQALDVVEQRVERGVAPFQSQERGGHGRAQRLGGRALQFGLLGRDKMGHRGCHRLSPLRFAPLGYHDPGRMR